MKMLKNLIQEKSLEFAIQSISLYKALLEKIVLNSENHPIQNE